MSLFDYEDGDFIHTISDSMAMNMSSGDVNIVSSWCSEEQDD